MENRTYKILYIEDQPEMIELMQLTLKRMGCEVYGVTDGEQGIRMMHELQPDLVLLDLMLPGCDGWQVRKAMEADAHLRSLPVILVTARAVGLKNGADRQPPPADAYVTKPFSLAEIRSTIQSVLCRSAELARAA
jgi:CheY-like chemotaxis protein